MQRPGTVGATLQDARLLERSAQLTALEACFEKVRGGPGGSLVLLRGEAGIGKTSVVREFCAGRSAPNLVLWGACEPLFTPRPLAPVVDIASLTGGRLKKLAEEGGAPYEVLGALADEAAKGRPTVLVLEDLHWADEATLDVVRLLGRRVESFPALVVLTYRDDELEPAARLRIVLGELARIPDVQRRELARLSPTAVAELAEPARIDAAELYRRTGGNPFFISEVLAAGVDEIPETVRDAVLARAAGLSRTARILLEALAVFPGAAEPGLLRTVAGDAIDALDECLGYGIVISSSAGVMFRHELARLVIEESTVLNRRIELHARALRALDDSHDFATLAHHAEAANDAAAVLRFAPEAARQAASVGAHRESAAQYSRALRFAETLTRAERAELLHARAYQCMLTDQIDESVAAAREALMLQSELGDQRSQADTLLLLSDILWCPGRLAESHAAADDAAAILQAVGDGRRQVHVHAIRANRCIEIGDVDAGLKWARSGLELAKAAGDQELELAVETIIAFGLFLTGDSAGRRLFELIRARAVEAGLDWCVCNADVLVISLARLQRDYTHASAYLVPALRFASERGMELFRGYLLAHQARVDLDLGRWDAAAETATLILGEPRRSRIPKIIALAVLARVRARRGDPGVQAALDEALALAEIGEDLSASEPMAAARAEAAWLAGDAEGVRRETAATFELARRCSSRWVVAELAAWRRRVGLDDRLSESEIAGPYALEVAGAWEEAAARWRELACPYEAALALGESGNPDLMREAVEELHKFSARPAAANSPNDCVSRESTACRVGHGRRRRRTRGDSLPASSRYCRC